MERLAVKADRDRRLLHREQRGEQQFLGRLGPRDSRGRLVRGLDYYSKTVFEWVTDELGAQGTICAGGRYDGLVEQLGGKATPAIGFALGVERILSLLEEQQEQVADPVEVYFLLLGEACEVKGLQLAEVIREHYPEMRMVTHCGGGSFKSQMKKADKSGARIALILAEDELSNEQLTLKYLREKKDQVTVKFEDIVTSLADI